jgi:hypothetical protein
MLPSLRLRHTLPLIVVTTAILFYGYYQAWMG